MKYLLLIFEVVGVLAIFDLCAGYAIILARPGTEVHHPTPF
jgi:hypothetical protein